MTTLIFIIAGLFLVGIIGLSLIALLPNQALTPVPGVDKSLFSGGFLGDVLGNL